MNKTKLKTLFSFLFATVAVFSYLISKPKNDEISVSVLDKNQIQVITIVKDQSNTLIPVSFSIDEDSTIEQQLFSSLSKLIKGSYESRQYSALLPSSTQIRSVQMQKGILTLDFNEEFLKYDPQDEMRILEAIAEIGRQFNAQDIKLKVNGDTLNFMPSYHTPIPQPLNASIGINNFESFTKWIHNSEAITVYYCKEIEDQTLYVPKTIRTATKHSDLEKMEIISSELSVQNHLNQPLFTNSITVVSLNEQNDITIIECSKNLINESRIINEAMDCFMLSLSSMNFNDNTIVKVDGVVLSSLNDYLQNNSYNNFDFLFN